MSRFELFDNSGNTLDKSDDIECLNFDLVECRDNVEIYDHRVGKFIYFSYDCSINAWVEV